MLPNRKNYPFVLSWKVHKKDQGRLLKDFLKENNLSKKSLAAVKFEGGFISVNGSEATVRRILQAGDQVEVYFPPEVSSKGLLPERLPLEIIFEDDAVLVAVKPAGQSTIPSREHPSGSLANALSGYYLEKGLASGVHIVTRLDRDTSGLVLIAKHQHVHHLLSSQQQAGGVKRTYRAIAEGKVISNQGRIEAPIGRNPDSIIERMVREDGQYACTLYRVLRYFGNYSYMELNLLTGRTHQIRVHMAYKGHPLAGDDLYGGSLDRMARQALHCGKLTFSHPITQERMEFRAEPPEDFKKMIENISVEH